MSAPEANVRCGNCMEPHHAHRRRMEAAPVCPNGKGAYRPATEAELDAGYRSAFPDGPQPVATFRLDNRADVERVKAALSPDALNKFFGPGGFGMAGFMAAIEEGRS